MQQSIPKGICIAAPPNKLHQCSIDELTIEVLTADVHLHTVPCTFDGVSMDSSYWVHEVRCMVHGPFRSHPGHDTLSREIIAELSDLVSQRYTIRSTFFAGTRVDPKKVSL